MASRTLDDFENEWTFVDNDGKIDVEPRKNSVSYSKSPSREEEAVDFPSDLLAKDDSEGEAEFEVLSGFQSHPPLEDDRIQAAETGEGHKHLPDTDKSDTVDEFVAVHQSSCQCAAEDGIMIISNHFCMDQEVPSDVTDEPPLASEVEQQDQQSLLSSTHSSNSISDGWRELPQLSESGSFLFDTDYSNSSEEDNAIEPIPEEEEDEGEEESQDFVDLSHEADPLKEMVKSTCSVFSFDSDLFSPSDVDEDVDNDDNHSDIPELIDISDMEKEKDQDQEKVEEVEDHLNAEEGHFCAGTFFVDIPTLFVVLGVTTALGFSIGYGLSVYVSNQALEVSGSIKRPGPRTASLPLSSDPMEPLDDLSRDFLDQLAMWKLEDRLDAPKEQEPETEEMEDLFDTKTLHEKLQLKHFKLMGLHESVKQRLRMAKVMSWYWRLKYEGERVNKEDSEWSKALQGQLHDTEKLYLQEKQVADLWRRMNENTKLRQAVAGGIKVDKHWKNFLHRLRKDEDKSPGVNESEKVPDLPELHDTPEKKELVEVGVMEHQEQKEQERKRQYIPENIWVDFRNRWTIDSKLKRRTEIRCSETGKCTSGDTDIERKDLTVVSEHRSVATVSPLIFPGFLDKTVEKSINDPEALTKTDFEPKKAESLAEDNKKDNTENNPEEISNEKHADFKGGAPFENPLFPNGVYSPGGKLFVASKYGQHRIVRVISFPGGMGNARWYYEDGSIVKETSYPGTTKQGKACKKSVQNCQRINSYEALVKRKCEVDGVAQGAYKVNSYPLTPTVPSKYLQLRSLSIISFPNGTGDVRWVYEDGTVVKETIIPEPIKQEKFVQKEHCRRIDLYEALALRKCYGDGAEPKHKSPRRRKLSKKQDAFSYGNRTVIYLPGECLVKEKQKLRNLSQLRGEEIRKQRIQRRDWKKKQRQADVRREVAKRLLLELRREKRRIQADKKQLRRSWKALKQEKKRISRERELHKKNKEELKNFLATLKEEKQKLKRKKVKLKKKAKELLAKERENLKLKEKALYAENKKEAERLRREIAQEKNNLRRKKHELKSLKKAAKKEYKKWLREMRKIKRQEKEKREAEQARIREEARKKREQSERERQRKREYDSVIREQAKYDKEKRSRKGEYGDNTRDEWRKANNNVKEDETGSRQSDSKQDSKQSDRGESFRQQLEDVKKWLSDVHKKALEQQRIYWPGTLLKPVLDAIRGRPRNPEPQEEEKSADMKQRDTNSVEEEKDTKYNNNDEDTSLNNEWEGRDCEMEETKKWEMAVSKSEVAKTSEDKAVMGFPNLTFGTDLIDILLKGFDKQKREDHTVSKSREEAESTAFIIISEESDDYASGASNAEKKASPQKPKYSDRKPKRPDGKPKHADDWWHGQHKWPYRHHDSTEEIRALPQGPITAEDIRVMSEGPTPPRGLELSLEERYEKRSHVPKTKRKTLTPQGPTLSEDVHQARSSQGKKRLKREPSYVQDKVCSSDDPDNRESIPPPDWLFERAKGRSHQQSAPWYVRRAEDREYQRSTDKHDSQFPCGRKPKRFKGPLDPSWFFDRADDRAFQRLNNEPWYSRRSEGRETERQKGHDSWFIERGYYRSNLHDLSSSWYEDHNWMPQGPSMEEHR